MKKILILFFLATNIYSCKAQEWKTLSTNDYQIEYPATWKLNQSGQMGMEFLILSPQEGANDHFRENINLIIQDLPENITLEKFAELSENQIKTLMTNSRIIKSKTVPGEKYNHHEIIYTGKQGIFDLEFMQYYWIIGNKAYVLTFTAEEKNFDKFLPVAQKIMNSFTIKSGM